MRACFGGDVGVFGVVGEFLDTLLYPSDCRVESEGKDGGRKAASLRSADIGVEFVYRLLVVGPEVFGQSRVPRMGDVVKSGAKLQCSLDNRRSWHGVEGVREVEVYDGV